MISSSSLNFPAGAYYLLNTKMLQETIGIIILFFSMVLQVIIPPLPAELIVVGGAKLYGILITTIVAGTGLYLGSILVYLIGSYIHKRFGRFFNKKKVNLIIEKLKNFEDIILWIRLLPYNPADTIAYAAGIMKLDFRKFLIIGFFTSYIRCFLLAYLGSYMHDLGSTFLILIIILFSGIIAYGTVFWRKLKKEKLKF